MKKLLFLLLFPFMLHAQQSNKPVPLPDYSPFRLDPFAFSFQVDRNYLIEGDIVAEVYDGTVKKIDSTQITVTVAQNYVTVSFTQAQVSTLPSISQCYISWGIPRSRKVGAELKPSVGTNRVNPKKIDVGIVEVHIVGDTYNSMVAAARAEAAADSAKKYGQVAQGSTEGLLENVALAKTSSDTAVSARNKAIAAKDSALSARGTIQTLNTQINLTAQATALNRNEARTAADSAQARAVYSGIAKDTTILARASALLYRNQAQAARDAALIQSGVYATEALGRAAVADGQAFKVQGDAANVAAYEYRRTNSTTSALIATYPSLAAAQSGVTALSKVEAVEAKLPAKNLANPATMQDGRTVNSNGTTGANATSTHTDFIPCVPGQVISYSDTTGIGAIKVNFATSAQVNISQITSAAGDNTTTFTAPVNAYFFRVTFATAKKPKIQIEYASAPTGYAPFGSSELISTVVSASAVRQNSALRFVSDAEKAVYIAKLGPESIVTEISKNLFDQSLVSADNRTINSNGTTAASTGFFHTLHIPVTPGLTYSYQDGSGSGAPRVNFYTSASFSTGAAAGQIKSSDGTNTVSFVIPTVTPAITHMAVVVPMSRDRKAVQIEQALAPTLPVVASGKKLLNVLGATIRPDAGDIVQTSTTRFTTDTEKSFWNLKVDSDPYLTLPKVMYGVVGKEFNLYYDTFTLLPEYGPGTPNFLFDINCSVGKMDIRSFRFTPTSGNAGDWSFKFRTYGNTSSLYKDFENVLKVVPASNPSTVKNVLHFGDSTIDEGTATKTLQENLAALGGNVPVFHGQHHPAPYRNEARTGNTTADFARGKSVHKVYFSGLNPALNISNIRNAYYSASGGSTRILLSERWKINPDGTGWAIGYNPTGNFVPPSTFPATLTAVDSKTTGDGFPSTITITSVEALSGYSIFKDNEGIGALNIANYRTAVLGLASGTKFDAVIWELGINDGFGLGIMSDLAVTTMMNDKKSLIAAFLADNPNTKIIICLPKSRSSDHYNTNRKQTMMRFTISKIRERLKTEFDFNTTYPNVFLSQAAFSVDRFFDYPHSSKALSTRNTETYLSTDDDVHPATPGYQKYADGLTGALIYVLSL